MTIAQSLRGRTALLAALLLGLASLALRWPGVPMYDSVAQYGQILDGAYTDWHPPIMARSWALLRLIWPGTAPFFLLQMLLWWGGLGLIAQRLRERGRAGAGWLILAIGAFPLFLGWETVILKDAQMTACLVAAAGLVGWWRLADRPLPLFAIALVALLLVYASFVRGNAAFATVPLGLALAGWGGLRRWWLRGLAILAGTALVIAVAPILNQRLLRAEATHNDRSLLLYDLAGIAHHGGLATMPGIAADGWREAERRGCYSPFFWNPYGEPAECGWISDLLTSSPDSGKRLIRAWIGLVATHPLAYAEHRLDHLNANLRFLVGGGERDAVPPAEPEPNGFGLGARSTPGGRGLVIAAKALSLTPLGWPIVWLAGGLGLLAGLRGLDSEPGLARAIALSAVVMGASYAVISPASDLRYHLWSMVAVAMAIAIGWRWVPPRRRGRAIVAPMLTVAVLGIAARLLLPPMVTPLPIAVIPAGDSTKP